VSELSRSRRNWIIAGVLAIGLVVGAAEIVVSDKWSDWDAGVSTPIALQVLFLAWGIDSIFSMGWAEIALFLPIGLLFYATFSLMSVAHLLVPESKRKLWARLILILLFLSSAIGWWANWPLLHWGPHNSWRSPLACAAAAFAALSLIGYGFWRRNPDGRAAFWYPAILQVWIQSVWIPWPDND
jgi:hypothetical protein